MAEGEQGLMSISTDLLTKATSLITLRNWTTKITRFWNIQRLGKVTFKIHNCETKFLEENLKEVRF